MEWNDVIGRLRGLVECDKALAGEDAPLWRSGQDASLAWMADRLEQQPGVLVADEVGLGKTRLALALAVCVASCGGRVAFLVPPGLIAQWRDDELGAFLRQLRQLPDGRRPSWIDDLQDLESVELKTYRDLFVKQGEGQAYPLSKYAPLLFISHRFGLPQRIGNQSRDERWGLPFALKGKLFGGHSVKGAKQLDISEAQQQAITWLSEKRHMRQRLKNMLEAADLGRVRGETVRTPENESLFQELIGTLIGDVDLIIIDEAHKNRLGADLADLSKKTAEKSQEWLTSRMSACLNNILLRPGSGTLAAKRLALTATPMEMDASQWSGVLYRIGLDKPEVERLSTIALRYSDAVKGLTVGSPAQVETLKQTAAQFRQAFAAVMTRRLWRDHPSVRKYSEATGVAHSAHPHRRQMPPHTVRLSTLPPAQRRMLAHAECLAVASHGIETEQAMKTAGARLSQGLPLWSEDVSDVADKSRSNTEQAVPTPAARAKQLRQAYWLQKMRPPEGSNAVVSLQWHPRIKAAVDLIEELSRNGEKVLVFGAFLAPMRALDRALNIRHYLRDVRNNTPTALPTGLSVGDADMAQWIRDPEFAFTDEQIAAFPATAQRLGEQYSRGREKLRDLCRKAVDEFLRVPQVDQNGERENTADQEDKVRLTNWLVQSMIVGSDDDPRSVAGSHEEQAEQQRVRSLLEDICDTDTAATDGDGAVEAEAEALALAYSSRQKAVKRHLAELDDAGDGATGIFRMSPFSQMLVGDTKPGTRRVRQRTFNEPRMHPRVLIGQATVASEGLNLHRSCRKLVLFHLDWNPGRIEQQIGRVDRQGSHWMEEFQNWLDKRVDEAPTIDIHTIAIGESYDELRTEVVQERAKVLRSQLFGEILPIDVLNRLPEEAIGAISQVSIDFTPPKLPWQA